MGEITREDVKAAEAEVDTQEGTPGKLKPASAPPAQPAATEQEEPGTAPTGPLEPASGDGRAPSASEGPDLDAISFPDHESVPELLRGKKGSEAVKAYQTLFDTSKRMAAYLQQQQTQPQPHPAQPQQTEPLFNSDDFISGDPAAIEEKMGQLFMRKAAPLLTDIYRGMTLQTMQTARSTLPHFAKYEAEIMAELNPLPINQTANYATWKDAHDRVVARHIDEIAAERGRQRPPIPVTERGNSAPPADTSTDLTPDDIKIADGLGVSRELFARMKGVYAGRTGEV